MGSPRNEFDLLLEAPTSIEADMAREILGQAGIPTYLHGRDRDLAELGAVIHNGLTRPDLYVPKGRRDEAASLLKDVWDASALSDDVALSAPAEESDPRRVAPSRQFWSFVVGVVLLVAAVLVYYSEYFTNVPHKV